MKFIKTTQINGVIIFPLALAFLSSCAVGPGYKKPDLPSAPTIESIQTHYKDSEVPRDWWSLLNDQTLSNLIDQAYANNQSLVAAQANLLKSRSLHKATAGNLYPHLAAGGSIVANQSSLNSNPMLAGFPGYDRETTLYQGQFDASWEIDLFGRNKSLTDAAEADVEIAKAHLGGVFVSVSSEVAQSYIVLRNQQFLLETTHRKLEILDQQLALKSKRLEFGKISELEFSRFEEQVSLAHSALPLVESRMESTLNRIEVLVGESGSCKNLRNTPGIYPKIPENLPIGVTSDIISRRPDLIISEKQLVKAYANQRVATANLYPRFSLFGKFGSATIESGDFAKEASEFWSIGPSLYLPVFQGGSLKNMLEASEHGVSAAAANFKDTYLRAISEVESKLIDYSKSLKSLSETTKANEASTHSYSLEKTKFSEGAIDQETLLTAEFKHLESEERLMQTKTETILRLVAMYKSLGGGW